jgi:hypothetical protein
VSIERGMVERRVAAAVLYIGPRPATQTESTQTNKETDVANTRLEPGTGCSSTLRRNSPKVLTSGSPVANPKPAPDYSLFITK